MFTARTLKILAASYAIKTLLMAAAWLMIPDLPDRARAAAQHGWTWVLTKAGR